jgi:4-hydroxy-3-polyprenylbenzoate decarboxylase
VRAATCASRSAGALVLLFRENAAARGSHRGHGAGHAQSAPIVMPPVPAFYHRPATIDDLVTQTVGRDLDLFGIDTGIRRWKEDGTTPS